MSGRHHRPNSAFALVYLLLVTAVMLLLVGSLLSMARQQVWASQVSVLDDQALYAAEAGLAAAISNLDQHNAWNTGFSNQVVSGGTATYSLRFAGLGSPGPLDSINNLNGVTPADSYLGSHTVPPHTALLIVQGQQGGFQKTIEALVGGGSEAFNYYSLSSSGGITFDGSVSIYGIDSVASGTSIAAGIHSNDQASGRQVSWNPAPPPTVQFFYASGTVSSSSSDPASVYFPLGSNYSVGGTATAQPQIPFPHYNIPAIVQAQSASPGPALVAGPSGAITLGPGNYYYSGNQNLAGDLILQPGAHLYVNGDLTVNGAITGNGVVAVTGNTSFYGSANVVTSDSDYVALLSQGNVHLQGFDGTAYLTALAQQSAAGTLPGDPAGQLNRSWTVAQGALSDLATRSTTYANATTFGEGTDLAQDTLFNHDMAELAPYWSPADAPSIDNLGAILNLLPTSGAPALFMRQRLAVVRDLLRPESATSVGTTVVPHTTQAEVNQNEMNAATAFNTSSYAVSPTAPYYDPYYSATYGGLFDSVESSVTLTTDLLSTMRPVFLELTNTLNNLSFNSLGSAFFQGIVYSNGAIVTSDEITVVGGVLAQDNGSQSPATVGGISVRPGELHFEAGTHVTYVKSMFNAGSSSLANAGLLSPLTWHVR